MPVTSLLVVLAFMLASIAGGFLYFRRVRINRPPIGVVNLRDALILVGLLIVMPYLYLALPLVVVTALLAVIVLTALFMTLEPLVPHRPTLWVLCLGAVAADITLALSRGVTSDSFLLFNNVVLCVVVIGAANLWAQSGMKAREVAVLAAVLTCYDFIATWQLHLMTEVFLRLGQLPLVPVVAWGITDPNTSLRLGLGDLLMLTVTPLVFRKAFGRRAGLVALGSSAVVLTVMLTLMTAQIITGSVPVMGVLGPMIVAQYWYWTRTVGTERTTREYLRAEPLTAS
jgi:hypothetical protein